MQQSVNICQNFSSWGGSYLALTLKRIKTTFWGVCLNVYNHMVVSGLLEQTAKQTIRESNLLQ